MKKGLRIGLLVTGLLALLAFAGPGERYFEIAKSIDIFTSLFKEVNSYYVDEVEPEKLVHTGIQGMLESLDPYTDYIAEENLEAFSIQTTGQYAGIGALVGQVNKKTVITHPYEGFPAQKAGLHVGDEIISVDGKDLKGKPTTDVSEKLKGNPATPVDVTVRRMGKDITFHLTREKIKVANVTYQGMLSPGLGYIRLDEFTPGAAQEVEAALRSLKQEGAQQLILDLRDNPGGLLYEAVNIVNLFVPKGEEVVSTRGKIPEWNKTYATLNEPVDTTMPLIVLTSGGSASAAEIVAGSLQDYDRAVLIGQKTFGKGLVQVTRQLVYNTQLKVTTAKYYIPSGRCIQALDYAHRKADGSVEKFADSLRGEFKTKSGRRVYDGSGLEPDIAVKESPVGDVVIALVRSGNLFEFSTQYCETHPEPGNLRTFRLSDNEYQQFIAWLKEHHFTFNTQLEQYAQELTQTAKDDPGFIKLQPVLNDIRHTIDENKIAALLKFRNEIQPILEAEIAFHYRLNRGRVASSLDRDDDIQAAMKLMREPAAYQKLLTPH